MLQTKKIEYVEGGVTFEGYYAYDDSTLGKKPAVLVFHDWSGRNNFACQKAEKLVELGYMGFAVDMFGKGKLGVTNEEKMELITPLMNDRALIQRRVLAAFDTVRQLENVNTAKMGAIGFCFGGLCALDLARSGAELKGVVSFHGLLSPPETLPSKTISAKILVLHGHDDPMVPPKQVSEFENVMDEKKVDWQIHIYSQTKHAFMNPQAHDDKLGTVYNKTTEKRAWMAMENFFGEILG